MKPRFKRILLKPSGENLGGESGTGFDFAAIRALTEKICQIHDLGVEIALVLGGGNFFRGTRKIPFDMDRVAADHIGMLATVMNGICIKESLIAMGKQAVVMNGLAVPSVGESFHKAGAVQHLQQHRIVVFAGGTGNPYFSTDTAAVLRGLEIDADIIIKGTKVDGVYDDDPVTNPNAVKFSTLTYTEVLEKKLKVMDATAIALCRDNEIPLSVLSVVNQTDLNDFILGKEVGTFIKGS